MDKDVVELLVPYFTFRDLPKKDLLSLRVYINESKFKNAKFELSNGEILISTDSYKNKKYYAKIYLPVEVVELTENILTSSYDKNIGYYEVLLKKCMKTTDIQRSNIRDLDLISCHLAWRNKCVESKLDQSDIVTDINRIPTSQNYEIDTEDMGISLNNMKLTVEDNSVIENKVKDHQVPIESVTESLENLQLIVRSEDEKIQPSVDEKVSKQLRIGSYGFACQYKNRMSCFEGNWKTGIELPEPENSNPEDRKMLRWEKERQSFDVEHYLSDFFLEEPDDDEDSNIDILKSSISFKPYWHCIGRASDKVLTTRQMILLAGLPCKEFNLNETEQLEVLHSLLDIILAYAYDYRLTKGKHNSESAWNINKLSATLSWFEVHQNAGEAAESFFRRSFTYPLCRCWILSRCVFKDSLEIFYLGRRQILNCLLNIYELFDADDDRKILNELYIEDYLIWIQQVHPEIIKNYVKLIQLCYRIRKEHVFAELPAIEREGIAILKKHPITYSTWFNNISCLSNLVQEREINTGEISDSSSEDSFSDSEDTSSESEEPPSLDEEN